MRSHLLRVATGEPAPAAPAERAAPPAFDWSKVHLRIGVPTLRGGIEPACVESLMLLVAELSARGRRGSFQSIQHYGVCEARNLLVRQFLQGTSSHLLQVDADVSFPPELVIRMLELDVEIVGAPVRMKTLEGERYNVQLLDGDRIEEQRGAFRVKGIGAGLLLTKRSAIERVAAACKPYSLGSEKDLLGVFDPIDVDGRRFLDDYGFCARALALGMDVHAIFESRTCHHGSGVDGGWPGDFGAWVRRTATQTSPGAVLPPEQASALIRELEAIAAKGDAP